MARETKDATNLPRKSRRRASPLLSELQQLLESGSAHLTLQQALKGLPAKDRFVRRPPFPNSIWEIVEHMRLAQRDILDYAIGGNYQELQWPDAYWPSKTAPSAADWSRSLRAYENDRGEFLKLLQRSDEKLLAPLQHDAKASLLREALILADHTAYHIGQLVTLRRALGNWSLSKRVYVQNSSFLEARSKVSVH